MGRSKVREVDDWTTHPGQLLTEGTLHKTVLIPPINTPPVSVVAPLYVLRAIAPINFHAARGFPLSRASYLHQGHTRSYCRTSNYVFIKAEIKHINKMEIGFTECSKSGRFGRRTLTKRTNQHIKFMPSNRFKGILRSGSPIKFHLINLLLSSGGSHVKILANKVLRSAYFSPYRQ